MIADCVYSVSMLLRLSFLILLFLPVAAIAENPVKVDWKSSLPAGLEEARRSHRLVYVEVVTEWCGYCRRLQTVDYPRSEVQKLLSRFVTVSIDGDRQPEVARQFRVQGYPTLLILSPAGNILVRVDGYPGRERLVDVLEKTLKDNAMALRKNAAEEESSNREAMAGPPAQDSHPTGGGSSALSSARHPLEQAQKAMRNGQHDITVQILDPYIAGLKHKDTDMAVARFYRGLSLAYLGQDRAREDLLFAARMAPLPEQRAMARELLSTIQE